MKLKHALFILLIAVGASYSTIFLPPSGGITIGTFDNRQTNTTEFVREIYASGFPIKFYIPSGSDYGADFMVQGFIMNTVIILMALIVVYFVSNVTIKKTKE